MKIELKKELEKRKNTPNIKTIVDLFFSRLKF